MTQNLQRLTNVIRSIARGVQNVQIIFQSLREVKRKRRGWVEEDYRYVSREPTHHITNRSNVSFLSLCIFSIRPVTS